MAQERVPEIILLVVFFFIASLTFLVAPAALAQVRSASDSTTQPPIFLPAVAYDSGGSLSFSVAVGDLNGDGKPDLVAANRCASNGDCRNGVAGVLLGNGDGTFQPTVTYSSGGQYAVSVALGDVNGDGKLDLVVVNQCVSGRDCSTGVVGVLFGNGDGTFGPRWTYRSGGWYAVSVALGDVNGDAKPDLLVANQCVSRGHCPNGTIAVLLNNGDGTFQPAVAYGSGAQWTRSVALGDVNGDGRPDLMVANEGGVSVLLGNGDGTFQSAVAYGSGGSRVRSVAVRDVNGDAKPDLMVASQCLSSDCSNGAVGVLLGNGDGTFQPAVTYASGGLYSYSVAVGDVNGDGKPDLVMANQFGPTGDGHDRAVGVLLGHGDGTFQPAAIFGSGANWPSSVAVEDLNGDGKPDLVVANIFGFPGNSDGAVGVLLNDTPFCTTPPVITVSTTPTVLWPPSGKMVPVTVSGTITDSGCTVTAAAYAVTDEYGKVQPSGLLTLGPGGAYSFTVLLQASRLGADSGGRVYTVTVSASNNASRTGSEAKTVIVPHDQRH